MSLENWSRNEAPKRKGEVSIPELERIAAQFTQRAEAVAPKDGDNEQGEREVLDFSVPKPLEAEQSDSLREEIQRIEQEMREERERGV